jgi:putative transposase
VPVAGVAAGRRHKTVLQGSGNIRSKRAPTQRKEPQHVATQSASDDKGRWVDNVFVERLWRSVKYEEIYLRAYDSITAARASLGRYFAFYNTERRHQWLDRRTPDSVYYQNVARLAA